MHKKAIIASRTINEKGHCRRPWLSGLLASLLIPALLLPAGLALANPDKNLRIHERQLKTMKQRINQIDEELAKDRKLHDRESSKLSETEAEISSRLSALRQINQQIEEQGKRTKQLQIEQARAEAELIKQRELLIGQLRASYQNGRQEKVKLLLNQGNPATVGRMLGYHDYLAQARTQQIAIVKQQALALRALEAEIRQQLEALQTLREIQEAQLAQLESARTDRSQQVAELDSKIAKSGQALKRMQSEENALQRLVAAIRKQLSEIPAEFRNSRLLGESEGRLPWPVKGKLLASYGQPKNGTSLKWDGIWIGAKPGTPVRAVAVGRIVYVGRMHRYGLLVIAEHSDGYYSLYGHNQEARVEIGDPVKAGQIIAYAGDSGGHRHSGLYFELRKGKNPVNPIRWLSRN